MPMKSRLIAGAIAVVLAVAGTVVVVSYVRGADARALSGLDTVRVLVAVEPIAEGTIGTDLTKIVASKELPATAVLPSRVTDLDQLTDQVALVALEPGEQLLSNKFGLPKTSTTAELVIPPDLQQVTVLLELQRALGGQIKAGDSVGVFLSVDESKQTHMKAHNVLVTLVQQVPLAVPVAGAETDGADAAASTDRAAPVAADAADGETSGAEDSDAAPASGAPPLDSLTESLLVTLATTAPIAERIVFAANFGTVWLSNEPATASQTGTGVIDAITVFQ